RVVLIHELGQLTGTKELFNRGSNRLGIDQILRHQAFTFRQAQALTNGTLNTYQTNAELVVSRFAYATNATVTQATIIVHLTLTVTDRDLWFQHVENVVVGQCTFAGAFFTTQATVQLHPANAGQVIPLFREEQVVKQVLRRFFGRRLARAHHAIDFNQRFQRSAGRINAQGIRHERTAVQVVGVKRFNFLDTGIEDFGEIGRAHV